MGQGSVTPCRKAGLGSAAKSKVGKNLSGKGDAFLAVATHSPLATPNPLKKLRGCCASHRFMELRRSKKPKFNPR
ncbi:hypothetical protein [Campylobacter hyointestinalis]|uniref:hypothetical protein n=1 Tax=Campylobacter hyointestinalis TaxID=198 RepID=UPI000DCF38C3|nr:hypothetical protein [Campylobacter hyointestinalis]RAZ45315.1 hypothetical protein CHL14416_08575 [Campylobacter hyointestinalis subsp. lawsonii]